MHSLKTFKDIHNHRIVLHSLGHRAHRCPQGLPPTRAFLFYFFLFFFSMKAQLRTYLLIQSEENQHASGKEKKNWFPLPTLFSRLRESAREQMHRASAKPSALSSAWRHSCHFSHPQIVHVVFMHLFKKIPFSCVRDLKNNADTFYYQLIFCEINWPSSSPTGLSWNENCLFQL